MAQTPPSPGKKKKPIPSWYYVAGAGALVAVYYLYSRSKANATAAAASTAAAPTGAGATTPVAAGSYGNAGDLSALAPYLSQLQGANSTSGTSGVASTVAGQTQLGSGYYNPQQAQTGTPLTDANGNSYQWVNSLPELSTLLQSGTTTYYQPTPGVFLPVAAGQAGQSQLGPSTPQFIETSS
jgi:hypothetical protein